MPVSTKNEAPLRCSNPGYAPGLIQDIRLCWTGLVGSP